MAGIRRAIVLGVLAVGLLAATPCAARAGDGWWGDLDKGQSVRLSDVMTSPEAFRGRVLTFTCVFHRREREFNPLRTRFNAERYDNVSVWPDGKAVWLAADYEQDFPFLYVPRAHAQHSDLLNLEAFARIEVTGRIEAVLDGYPFIELISFRATGHRLGSKVVDKMTRVETYARSGDAGAQAIAVENAQSVLDDTPDLAPLYAARIRARLVELLRALGRTHEADAVLRGESTGSAAPEPSGAPGEASTPRPETSAGVPPEGPTPGAPFRPSLPGIPTDTPAPPVNPEPRAEAAPITPPLREPAPPARLPPPPPPPAPPGPFRPSLPGVPMDTPAPPVVPEPRAQVPPAPAVAPATAPATVAAPEVVDPPLPAPARNGAPPVRKPRLAGVK